MSNTARTDKKAWDADLGNMVVDADFARQLETELVVLTMLFEQATGYTPDGYMRMLENARQQERGNDDTDRA